LKTSKALLVLVLVLLAVPVVLPVEPVEIVGVVVPVLAAVAAAALPLLVADPVGASDCMCTSHLSSFPAVVTTATAGASLPPPLVLVLVLALVPVPVMPFDDGNQCSDRTPPPCGSKIATLLLLALPPSPLEPSLRLSNKSTLLFALTTASRCGCDALGHHATSETKPSPPTDSAACDIEDILVSQILTLPPLQPVAKRWLELCAHDMSRIAAFGDPLSSIPTIGDNAACASQILTTPLLRPAMSSDEEEDEEEDDEKGERCMRSLSIRALSM